MINIKLGETYGLGSFEEAVAAVETLRRRGFSDEEISGILERSKDNGGSAALKDTPPPSGVLIPNKKIPLSCDQCFCFHHGPTTGKTYCLAGPEPLMLEFSKSALGRHVFCPLIEVKGGDGNGTP